MPRQKPNYDFDIHVDPSCVTASMDDDTISVPGDVENQEQHGAYSEPGDIEVDIEDAEGEQSQSDTEEEESVVDEEVDEDQSHLETDTQGEGESYVQESVEGDESEEDQSQLESRPQSPASRRTSARSGDDAADSSSQHDGTDEDVFSNKSGRSSMGSCDAGSESGKPVNYADDASTATKSPRISDISSYQQQQFTPTRRGTQRPPFRTPSDVHEIQMSSPTPSVYGSPRSAKRHFQSVSRMGSPSASAQYSPKRGGTPPRFKRQEAPLVLLHVTLLPLRWTWGELMDTLDSVQLSESVKNLRDAWRVLQDRLGDTTVERGILLGHPQSDYEILEERLLEALDLPLRRRARILECGHYLGPSNETNLTEDDESEDEYIYERSRAGLGQHWCGTCKNEIRYASLGPGKIFRVKVFASNGLMRAGAWAACWKEMERVDVEIEPIVDSDTQDELARLESTMEERVQADREKYEQEKAEERRGFQRESLAASAKQFESASTRSASVRTETQRGRTPGSEEQRRPEYERMRQSYDRRTPAPESVAREPTPEPHRDAYMPPPSPRSPSEEAQERREAKRGANYQGASMPQLLLQSVKVLLRDTKNMIIIALSIFVLVFALRSTTQPTSQQPPLYEPASYQPVSEPAAHDNAPLVETMQSVPEPTLVHEPEEVLSEVVQEVEPAVEASVSSNGNDPCMTQPAVYDGLAHGLDTEEEVEIEIEVETMIEKQKVRVVKTITQTHTRTEVETEVETVFETAMPSATEVDALPEPTEATHAPILDDETAGQYDFWAVPASSKNVNVLFEAPEDLIQQCFVVLPQEEPVQDE